MCLQPTNVKKKKRHKALYFIRLDPVTKYRSFTWIS